MQTIELTIDELQAFGQAMGSVAVFGNFNDILEAVTKQLQDDDVEPLKSAVIGSVVSYLLKALEEQEAFVENMQRALEWMKKIEDHFGVKIMSDTDTDTDTDTGAGNSLDDLLGELGDLS